MGSKFKFLSLYFLAWVIFFELMRVLFLLYHAGRAAELPFATLLASCWYGLRMDISVAAYILAPVCLFVLLSLFIHFFRRLLVYRVYTIVVLLLISILSLADMELYKAWGFRIDGTVLTFLKTPAEAFASVSHRPLFFIALIFLAAYGLFYFCFRYLLKRIFFQQQNRRKILTGVLLLLFTGALIIPVRGGLQLAPLNQSGVYFSTYNFANHAAINASWNFLHGVLSKGSSGKNPYVYLTADRVQPVTDSLYRQGTGMEKWIRTTEKTPVNVLVIVWESFTEKAIHANINGQEVTPCFNRLKKEGLFFSNVYASGDRTYKGVPAILSGYPAMPNTTIIHSPAKAEKLYTLPGLFKEHGYEAGFYYGGEPEFANIKSYLLHAGFDPITGKGSFAKKDMNSKWGAHDGVVMERMMKELAVTRQPFFTTWLTLTSHEPFETPVPVVFEGKDNTTRFLNSHHYTDSVVGALIDRCREQPWWQHTVVIIIGDHGHPLPETGSKADEFRTPMLWLGGALEVSGRMVEKPVSQLDIAATLAAQLGYPAAYFPFSRNMADTTLPAWAFFTFNDGLGWADSAGRFVYDNVGKQVIEQSSPVSPERLYAARALLDIEYQDFLKK